MSSQCPVSTQMQTMNRARENDNNSAPVKRPQIPNDILEKKRPYIEFLIYILMIHFSVKFNSKTIISI